MGHCYVHFAFVFTLNNYDERTDGGRPVRRTDRRMGGQAGACPAGVADLWFRLSRSEVGLQLLFHLLTSLTQLVL